MRSPSYICFYLITSQAMKSQLCWVSWNFIKFEIKKGAFKRDAKFPNSIERWGEEKFCLRELWPFNAFTMLKSTFSKHRLTKISIIYMYIKPEVYKEWYSSNDCSYKWSLYRVIRWALLFHEKGMTLLIAEDVNLLRRIFLVGVGNE